ncbi:glycosyltransferase [Aquiflexum sp. LQ15W]|uniref:glycosyltransferase n=1 Tax=Cognataquiflexum nitidum TaxID=2922272 RepID=UPI001F12A6FA|nr:glycosyltransferase [Cognataquiflexum nitidum]MCH6199264.1 glycosyltransferase [Cognataquiflexum nitidum]
MFFKPKKEVVIISNTLLRGGAEKQCILLSNFLATEYNVKLIIYYGEQIDQVFLDLIDSRSIEIVFLKGNFIKKVFTIFKTIDKTRTFALISFLLTSNFLVGILGTLLNIKNRIGGIRTDSIKGWKWYFQLTIHKYFTTHTVFNNHSAFNDFTKKGFRVEKSSVIYNGVEKRNFYLPKEFINEKVTIISVSRFVKEKDIFTALEAVFLIKKRMGNKSFRYQLIGYGELEKEIASKINELDLSGEVSLIVNPHDINYYYQTADIFLSSSINEGLSNTILEAMNFGLPIIATNVGDNRKIINNERNGFICNSGDYEAICDSICFLIENKSLIFKMGLDSKKIIEDEFSIEKMGLSFSKLINS